MSVLRDQIEASFARGAGGDVDELMDRIAAGDVCVLALGGDGSASWRVEASGEVEVFHVFGTLELARALRFLAGDAGHKRVKWIGRRGWGRALASMDRIEERQNGRC